MPMKKNKDGSITLMPYKKGGSVPKYMGGGKMKPMKMKRGGKLK